MDFRRATLLLAVCYVSGIDCYIGTVDLFSLCGTGYGYDQLITDNDRLTVTMYSFNWPSMKTSCTVIFKASAFSRNLKLTFGSFKITDTNTVVEITEMVAGYYMIPTSFDNFFAPGPIFHEIISNRYLKVTVTRLYTTDTGLSVRFDINTDEFGQDHTDPLPDYSNDNEYDYTYLTLGSKLGIGFGTIIAITIVAVIIYYGRSRYQGTANGAVIVRSGNVATTTCSGIAYSNIPLPNHVAPLPAYPSDYTSAYSSQTIVFPSA